MNLFGLVGYPLTHSWSAEYFNRKFRELDLSDYEYRLFPIRDVSEIREIVIQHPEIRGINVTIPHKISILPFLDKLSQEAGQVGAVNCIKVRRVKGNPILQGFNTDVFGFTASLTPLLNPQHTRALVLGTGGASKAVCFSLDQLGISYTLVSRNPLGPGSLSYLQLSGQIVKEHLLIINTTPAGMFPDVEKAPEIPYEFLGNNHLLFDLIYNPEETIFLRKGREAGCTVKNGLEMLFLQAEKSWEVWSK